MSALERIVATPRMLEADEVVVGADRARVWQWLRHADLASAPLVRANRPTARASCGGRCSPS